MVKPVVGDDSSFSSSDDSSDDETTMTEDAKSIADTHINDNVVGVAHDCMVDNERCKRRKLMMTK